MKDNENKMYNCDTYTEVPTKWIGPIKILCQDNVIIESMIPLATFERPVWYAVERGAHIVNGIQALHVNVQNLGMTRSVLLEANFANEVTEVANILVQSGSMDEMKEVSATTSKFVELKEITCKIVGNLIYVRFSFFTGEAAGHNMTTKAANALIDWMLKRFNFLRYVSISGNFCVDKKVSAVNSILGRGRQVIVDAIIPKEICMKILRATPQDIVNINTKKNLIGSIVAGSVCSANAHFANMLLAFYLALGQDAANIVEGSQGISFAEMRGENLYFSITLPNIIVGAVGSGKDLKSVKNNLMRIIDQFSNTISNADKLATFAGACVWCGELSLLASLSDKDDLVRSHMILERKKRSYDDDDSQ